MSEKSSAAPSVLMTVKEAAESLRVSERTARGLLARGVIPFVRVSRGRVALLRRDVDA